MSETRSVLVETRWCAVVTALLPCLLQACSSNDADGDGAGSVSDSAGGSSPESATSGSAQASGTQGITSTASTATATDGVVGTSGGTAATDGASGVGGATSTSATSGATSSAGGDAVTSNASVTGSGGAATTGAGGTTSTEGGGSGGSGAGGETVCGTADEGSSATLTCPEGQIIESVVFASYGTPTGTCGNFVASDCDAASSATMVETSCVGRHACTVAAANGTFGDPCNDVTKSLAVEVSCVTGEPTTPDNAPYKGIANSPASEIASLGATWCYNWGTSPQASDCGDPLFVPMVWGDGDVAGAIEAIGNAGYDTVLGFNEPNKSDQANITVARAIELWPDLTSNPNIRVSSPAVSDDGRAWLEDFMDQAEQNGLRVDFIAMHWYGWNEGSCTAQQLEGAVNWASQWSRPVWVTEFGCMGSSNPDEQTLLDFFNAAIPMLDGHALVERYAWYPWNTYNDLYLESNGTRVRTALGDLFAAAPQYRP